MIKRGHGEFTDIVTDSEGNEIPVTVKWQGYSDPGRTYGPPEDCYSPEGDMELTITGAEGRDIPDAEYDRLEELAYEYLDDYAYAKAERMENDHD